MNNDEAVSSSTSTPDRLEAQSVHILREAVYVNPLNVQYFAEDYSI